MSVFKTAYSRAHMSLNTHGYGTFDFGAWVRDGRLVVIAPLFSTYDDIVVDGCWAKALTQIFGDSSEEDCCGGLRYMPGFPGDGLYVKFYYHDMNKQIWRLTKIR